MSDRFADESDMARGRSHPGIDDDPFSLSDVLVDQLLDVGDDAALPAAYQPLRDVLAATRQPATEAELAGELEAIAHFRAQFATDAPSTLDGRRRRRHRVPVIIAAGALGVVTATGVAAAGGNLPDPVQRVAAEVLSKLGITVPDGTEPSREQPVDRAPVDAHIVIPADAMIREESAAGDATGGDVTAPEPSQNATPDDTTAGADAQDETLGSPSVAPPLADPQPAVVAPPVDAAVSQSEAISAPTDPPPSSAPAAPSSDEPGPSVQDEGGDEPENQGGPQGDDQGGDREHPHGAPPGQADPGPPPDVQRGPPPHVDPGPPTEVQPGPPTDKPGQTPHVQTGPPPDVQPGPPADRPLGPPGE